MDSSHYPDAVSESVDVEAIRRLRDQATTHVGRHPGRAPLRSALYRVTGGRVDRRPRPTIGQLPRLPTPWQDTVSGRHFGWRCRQARLGEDFAFAVEYIVCLQCQLGWVDKPYTAEDYQRHGLASTALRVLREEHPGLAWHTGSGHLTDSKPFWSAVGRDVEGSYQPRMVCEHVARRTTYGRYRSGARAN